jgi:magnesium-transporting ATPase (P-type)
VLVRLDLEKLRPSGPALTQRLASKSLRLGIVIQRVKKGLCLLQLGCKPQSRMSEVCVVAGLPLPLLPLQILFLNLVTDVFPAFALATGEGEEDVHKKPDYSGPWPGFSQLGG